MRESINALLSNILLLIIVLVGFSYLITGGPKNKKVEVKSGNKKTMQEQSNATKKLMYIGVAIVILMVALSR